MSIDSDRTALQIRSLVKRSGELELSLASVAVPEPAPNEVLVRIEAAPINPSDLGLLFSAADMSTANASGTADRPVVMARIPQAAMKGLAARLDVPMPVGNEGAGVVVAAGSSAMAQALTGKTVAVLGGAMYSQYRVIAAAQCLPLPEGATPADGDRRSPADRSASAPCREAPRRPDWPAPAARPCARGHSRRSRPRRL